MKVQIVVPDWVDRSRGLGTLMAFKDGLRHLGIPLKIVPVERARPSTNPMVCWGVYKRRFPARLDFLTLQQEQKAVGGDLIILERGFVQRERYYYVGRGGLNGLGTQPHGRRGTPGDRWAQLGLDPLPPWKADGDEILLVGQVPWDTSCQHVDFAAWVSRTARTLGEIFPGKRLVFRPHPLRPTAIPTGRLVGAGLIDHVDRKRTLVQALDAAARVITFSSTVGVDAALHGVPVTACDPVSMIYGTSYKGGTWDRKPWGHWLAYCQWTHEEMRQGLPWLHIYGD